MISFRRQLAGIHLRKCTELQQLLANFTIQPLLEDRFVCRWNSDDMFTVHSFYHWLEFGIRNSEYEMVWNAKIPS